MFLAARLENNEIKWTNRVVGKVQRKGDSTKSLVRDTDYTSTEDIPRCILTRATFMLRLLTEGSSPVQQNGYRRSSIVSIRLIREIRGYSIRNAFNGSIRVARRAGT